jgi:sorbitol-specific phosphotransferase system component IIBC
LLAFVSALIILLIGMLGDAIAARLSRLNPQIIGVRTADFVEMDAASSPGGPPAPPGGGPS